MLIVVAEAGKPRNDREPSFILTAERPFLSIIVLILIDWGGLPNEENAFPREEIENPREEQRNRAWGSENRNVVPGACAVQSKLGWRGSHPHLQRSDHNPPDCDL